MEELGALQVEELGAFQVSQMGERLTFYGIPLSTFRTLYYYMYYPFKSKMFDLKIKT